MMSKGSTKLLVIVGLVAILVCSWYMLLDETAKENNQYNQYITVAREKAEMGLHQVALEQYDLARNMRDTIELRNEMAEVYKDYGNSSLYEEFCSIIVTDFPMEKVGYERLATFYAEREEYKLFYNIQKTANKRGVVSSVIEDLAKEMEYVYSIGGINAADVRNFTGGYCAAIRESGYWGLMNEKGKTALSYAYVKLGNYANDLVFAETKNGDYVLMDIQGKYISRVTDDRKIEDCSVLNSGLMAVKYNGKYHYCDSSFNELFGSYDYASVFTNGVAAVQNEGKWAIINEQGKQVTDFVFDDVKLDELGVAFRGERAFAKKGGAYILIDTTGKQVGNGTWEDADVFGGDMLAAVKKGGKWGFINADGKEVAACNYQGARSFCNGLAAVQIGDKWGFIDSKDYTLKIDALFDDTRDFTKTGTVLVKSENDWQVLQLYRMA